MEKNLQDRAAPATVLRNVLLVGPPRYVHTEKLELLNLKIMKAEKEGSESSAENTRQSGIIFPSNEKISAMRRFTDSVIRDQISIKNNLSNS